MLKINKLECFSMAHLIKQTRRIVKIIPRMDTPAYFASSSVMINKVFYHQGVGGNPECRNVTKVSPDGNITVVTELYTPGWIYTEHTHTHTHTNIYIYLYMGLYNVSVFVCAYVALCVSLYIYIYIYIYIFKIICVCMWVSVWVRVCVCV